MIPAMRITVSMSGYFSNSVEAFLPREERSETSHW
jgi:hypothetical protein